MNYSMVDNEISYPFNKSVIKQKQCNKIICYSKNILLKDGMTGVQ